MPSLKRLHKPPSGNGAFLGIMGHPILATICNFLDASGSLRTLSFDFYQNRIISSFLDPTTTDQIYSDLTHSDT